MKQINWDYYRQLNVNMWQGWWIGAKWQDKKPAVSTGEVMRKLEQEKISGLFQPDTLRWAAWGREQINEAEDDDNLRFRYLDHSCGRNFRDRTGFGNGRLVRYFDKNEDCEKGGEIVLSELSENTFQSLTGLPVDPMYQVKFPFNNNIEAGTKYINYYHIKPGMRINPGDVNNAPNKEVVRIIIKKFNGEIDYADTVTIYTDDFRVNGGKYNGEYIEDYVKHNPVVKADELNSGRKSNAVANMPDCGVDYEVFWYGKVSVWIDYVKVQDEAAYRLLTPDLKVSSGTREAITAQVNNLLKLDKPYPDNIMKGFYTEEVDYANLACLEFLNKTFLPSITKNPDYRMICLINPGSFQAYLHSKNVTASIEEYITRVNPPVLMQVDYQFIGNMKNWIMKLPENINRKLSFPSGYPQSMMDEIQGIYDRGVDYTTDENYNTDLQKRLNNLSDDYTYFNRLAKKYSKDIWYVPQIGFWHLNWSTFWMREPMNSEISAEFGIALCNGGKGIMPYAYESFYWPPASKVLQKPPEGFIYSIALGASDFDEGNIWGYRKREVNFCGENKWQNLVKLYAKMKSWGPVTANSTNTSGYSVTRDGAAHEFISDIASIDPHNSTGGKCTVTGLENYSTDCPKERYWEMGFFDMPNSRNKYFMMVNRRCDPQSGNYDGDDRVLMIKFNMAALTGASQWKIYEVPYQENSLTFSVNNAGFINLGTRAGNLGWFKPGESKLFCLVPVG